MLPQQEFVAFGTNSVCSVSNQPAIAYEIDRNRLSSNLPELARQLLVNLTGSLRSGWLPILFKGI
jgi:hypothetical protein